MFKENFPIESQERQVTKEGFLQRLKKEMGKYQKAMAVLLGAGILAGHLEKASASESKFTIEKELKGMTSQGWQVKREKASKDIELSDGSKGKVTRSHLEVRAENLKSEPDDPILRKVLLSAQSGLYKGEDGSAYEIDFKINGQSNLPKAPIQSPIFPSSLSSNLKRDAATLDVLQLFNLIVVLEGYQAVGEGDSFEAEDLLKKINNEQEKLEKKYGKEFLDQEMISNFIKDEYKKVPVENK